MSTERILVIDDERNLCIVIKACLEKIAGWKVVTSQSGSNGLQLAESFVPDAILLDVMMPDLDGLALLRLLRSNPVTKGIPVVLLTAKAETVDRNQCAQLGIAGIISKPFDPLKLTQKVAKMLGWE